MHVTASAVPSGQGLKRVGELALAFVLSSLIGLGLGVLAAIGLEALLSGFGITLPSGPLVFEARTVANLAKEAKVATQMGAQIHAEPNYRQVVEMLRSGAIGPIKDRGDPTGLIIRHGYLIAEWGDPLRVDMSYSVTKSFLSSVVGIAVDRGMIKSINDAVRDYMAPIQVYNPFPLGNKAEALTTPATRSGSIAAHASACGPPPE